jgi:tetratricopeptide (TPR) repeat protein
MASFKCAMKLSELLLEEDIEELLRESNEDELSALSDALSSGSTHSYCVKYALYFHTGNIEFLHRAIEIARCMLDQPLAGDSGDGLGDRAALFSNLSRLLETRFQCAGDVADLVCAISFAESALNLTSPDHDHSKTFTEHLDTLVAKKQRVSDILEMSEGDADQGDIPLHVLADKVLFLMRYRDYQESIGKHDKALELGRAVVQTSSPRHPDLVDNLLKLATILTRPQDDGSVSCGFEEIQEALGYCQRAADLCAGFSDHSKCLRNLSVAYMSLSTLGPQNAAIVPLDNAISVAREALRLVPIEDPRRPIYLFSLGSYVKDLNCHQKTHFLMRLLRS